MRGGQKSKNPEICSLFLEIGRDFRGIILGRRGDVFRPRTQVTDEDWLPGF